MLLWALSKFLYLCKNISHFCLFTTLQEIVRVRIGMFSFSFDVGESGVATTEKSMNVAPAQAKQGGGVSSSVVNILPPSLLPFVEVPCPHWVSALHRPLLSSSSSSTHSLSPSAAGQGLPPHIELDFFASSSSSSSSSSSRHFRLNKVDVVQHPGTLHNMRVPTNHDIVPNKYGGGYKVWECSLDLVQFLLDELDEGTTTTTTTTTGTDTDTDIGTMGRGMGLKRGVGSTVLELGCGHGLPGAAAISLLAPSRCVFSDLNEEVLQDITWCNVAMNGGLDICTGTGTECNVQCVAGDWTHLTTWLGTNTFDIILSAETLYNDDNCVSIKQLLLHHLTPISGVAYFATKRYYFGVGGGTESLQKVISASASASASAGTCTYTDGRTLKCTVVRSIEDGNSNIRDIVQVRWE